MDSFSVKVPVRRHVKKYFLKLYNGRFKVDFKTNIGVSIISILNSQPEHFIKSKMDVVRENNNLNDMLPIYIPIDQLYRVNKDVNEYHYYTISRYLERKFNEDMYHIIGIGSCFGVSKFKAVRAFLEVIDVEEEDDIKIDTIMKNYYRKNTEFSFSKFFLDAIKTPFTGMRMG